MTYVRDWLLRLDDSDYELVIAALDVLREEGPTLGRPLVDTVAGSRYRNMKELRPGSSGRSELRILFAFDRARAAILLVAGDKSGQWNQWHSRSIPEADMRFAEHLERMEHDGDG